MTATILTIPTLTIPGLRGGPIDVAPGTPLLVVNTASLCGFTGQYAGLQRLHERYAPQGLRVLAIPSADFGGQEHANAADTLEVCDRRFGATFPIAATTHVKGAAATPLFRWLAAQAGPLGRPRWNFYKYVIGRDGRLVQWFTSLTTPEAPRLRAAIERALHPG